MHNYLYLWLGARRAQKRGAAAAAVLLDRAAHARLPVPPGILLLDDAWQYARQEKMVTLDGANVLVADPVRLQGLIAESGFQRPLLLQPVFVDGAGAAAAGIPPQRRVASGDATALAAALTTLWTHGRQWLAGRSEPDGARLDIILMEEVDAGRHGQAVMQAAFETDPVHDADGRSHDLPRLAPGEWPSTSRPAQQRRLQLLLRGLRRTLGPGEWQVTWADDGRVCWLLAVTPLVDAPARPETYSRPLLTDILPEPPPPLLAALLRQSNDDWLALGRQLDPTLAAGRPLLALVDDRPVLNISYLRDLERRWGTRLLPDSTQERRRWPPGRWAVQLRLWWWRRTAARRQADLTDQLNQIGASPPASVAATLAQTRQLITAAGQALLAAAVAGTTPPLPALDAALARLRRQWQVLAGQMVAEGKLRDANDLWELIPVELEALAAAFVDDAPPQSPPEGGKPVSPPPGGTKGG